MIGSGFPGDTIYAGSGDDFISAEEGDDYLYGEKGNDSLSGAVGSDRLYGGEGNDVFLFWERAQGDVDRICDFEDGIDVIEIARIRGRTALDKFKSLDIRQKGSDVWIKFDDMTIVVEDMDGKNITVADFIF